METATATNHGAAIAAIAEHLNIVDGPGWVAESVGNDMIGDRYNLIKVGTPDSIFCNSDGWQNKGKWHFSGYYPRNDNGELYHPSTYDLKALGYPVTDINASTKKTPKQLAKEIYVRLLPGLRPIMVRMSDRVKDSNEYHNAKHETCKAVGLAFHWCKPHGENVGTGYHEPPYIEVDIRLGTVWGNIEPSREDSTIHLHNLSASQLMRVLKAIEVDD